MSKPLKCSKCGAAFSGPFARQDFRNHKAEHLNPDVIRPVFLTRPNSGPTIDQNGQRRDGYTAPDIWGHWRKPRDRAAKNTIEYLRAIRRAEALDWKYSVERFVSEVFEADGCYPKWNGKISPLQRLSWAFIQRDWEAVKAAAYGLVYDTILRRKLADYLDKIHSIAATLDGYLSDLERAALFDDELDEHTPGEPGIN